VDQSVPREQEGTGDFDNLREQGRPGEVPSPRCRNFEKERLEQLIEKYKMPYYCVSAKTGSNIEELFYKIAELLDRQETDKLKKMKQTYSEDYEQPPATFDSLTRSQTHHTNQTSQTNHHLKEEEDKEKVVLVGGARRWVPERCQC
jgi:GTPase SAR1 family protein